MKTLFAAACVIAISIGSPAGAQSIGEKTGINSALGIAPTTADFVKEVAVSDMFELESSKLAADKADEPTKNFAKEMIKDHTKTSTELKEAVAGDQSLTIPTALDSAHQAKLDKLKAMSGTDFTKQYRSDQVTAHKDAVSLFQRYAKGGDNAKLKEWAAKTLPALEHHLSTAQQLYQQSASN